MSSCRFLGAGLCAAAVLLLSASPAAAILPTSTSLSASPNPSCAGHTVAMRATVVSANPLDPASGNVDFKIDGTARATVPLDGNGAATFATAALGAGGHQLQAIYSGSLVDDPSASGLVSQQVKACGGASAGGAGGGSPASQEPPPKLIAAAGDIACGTDNPSFNGGVGVPGACQQLATANLLGTRPTDAVLPLGDLQYGEGGSLEGFIASYDRSWGRWREISHPAIGNHEYDHDQGPLGYWDYWNGAGQRTGRAGIRGRGWYSYDIGGWHLVALNSNCDIVSCRPRSRQIKWLRRNLRRHKGRCVLAYMHHPRFTSGIYEGQHQSTGKIWRVLYRDGVDVVLNGHVHIYERFAPLAPSGRLRPNRGIREFTVGTGGEDLFGISSTRAAHSRYATSNFGVLFMRLEGRSYRWSFVDISGKPMDEGETRCHPAWPRHGHHSHHKGHHHGGAAEGHTAGTSKPMF